MSSGHLVKREREREKSTHTQWANLNHIHTQLERNMRANSLNDKISHRPSPEKLVESGVLHADPRSAEEKYAEAMDDEYAKREGGA